MDGDGAAAMRYTEARIDIRQDFMDRVNEDIESASDNEEDSDE